MTPHYGKRRKLEFIPPLPSSQGTPVDKALKVHMPEPMCLIENVEGQLRPNQKALDILSAITQPVVVVAIVGLYRTGKSYLMNKLAGKKTGFALGSTVQGHTKGIWMWCVPHPQKTDHTLVLLDTEGLCDVEKGNSQNDCWIFALAILLSSTFVYNSTGAINQQAMDQLHYVTELTDRIRTRSSPDQDGGVEDSADFVSFFPDFVWTLRDMTLRLEADGQSLMADEYLENSLKLKKGACQGDKNYNLPRLCIRKFFPKKRCFVFYPPTHWKKLSELESLWDDELDSDFVQQVAEFCSFIFSSSKVKALPGGIKVNGAQLGVLVQTYVDTISSGIVPCLENAVMTLAQHENSIAVHKAADHYSEQMAQRVRLPTDTLQELLDVHTACEKEAIAVFMEHSFKDDQRGFQKKLMETIEERKEAFMQQNRAASLSHCQAELEKLSEPLRESISSGVFSVPGGHSLYLEARKKVEQDYERVPRKGVKASEVFQNFLKSHIPIEESFLHSDKALTDGQKAMAAEQAKKEAAEKELKIVREQQKEKQEELEALMRSFSENISQLQEKMKSEIGNLLIEQQRVLDHKLKAQEKLAQEGYEEQCDELIMEIKLKEQEIQDIKQDQFSKILDEALAIFHDVLAKEVMKRYLESMEDVADTLAKMYQSLTEKEKQIEVERIRADVAEAANRALEEMQRKHKLMMGLKEKSYQEHVGQLTEKMEQQWKDLMAEQEHIISSGVHDSANFVGFFPIFVWALRDISLDLEFNGKHITADEYLELSLTLKKDDDEKN
ncbi:guanylate-binding protein 1-like [Acomys russatus]|uniref:guanylate-binding protein 1-like n=1 Tax=Acomys russatus TaxID=60746 RepID=UPI0021E2CE54|nr:guanylate-binding protein 1-like [Acomys russatus]